MQVTKGALISSWKCTKSVLAAGRDGEEGCNGGKERGQGGEEKGKGESAPTVICKSRRLWVQAFPRCSGWVSSVNIPASSDVIWYDISVNLQLVTSLAAASLICGTVINATRCKLVSPPIILATNRVYLRVNRANVLIISTAVWLPCVEWLVDAFTNWNNIYKTLKTCYMNGQNRPSNPGSQ